MLQPVKWNIGNSACPPSIFRRYIEQNNKRGLEELVLEPVRNDPLYIVCSGPSLLDTWQELVGRPGEIWALNAAFDWICKKGIRPDYGICLAGENAILRYFQESGPGDKYLFASQTHPELMDRVIDRGGKVTLWHPAHPPEWNMPIPKGRQIYGGGTVGSRSFELAYVRGFRDVHVLGMDGCLSVDRRIAVETPIHDNELKSLRTFIIHGRAFVAMPSHAKPVEDMTEILRALPGMQVTFYGDGLMQWAMANAQTPTLEGP